ncbi:replication factor C subunit 3 [Histomonas meleagridis]|uniref:replication factor C subunit 3 n=1 Tax=Histomonas meleagridis TaxID=135588 RepID=UPI003559D4D4|nr:replication factor C subunit 3 [Histomonas meleagridis]KAH0807185.1 replication factor C subunit 3 [Histomonas meleagridis]
MSLWIDRHRPQNLSELTIHPETNAILDQISQTQSFPHLLFCGPNGSGKKTRVMAFLRKLFNHPIEVNKMRTEYRVIEAGDKKIEVQVSSSPFHVEITPADAGNNDRHVISFFLKELAASQTVGDISIKVVVINEANRLSRLAQQALRRTMEKYAKTCRLILICDSLSQIIEPVRSRCLIIRTPLVPKPAIFDTLKAIAAAENYAVDDAALQNITEESNGNLRRAIILLEMLSTTRSNGSTLNSVIPEWERYTDEFCKILLEEQLVPETMKKIRNHLYELLVHCIPPTEIFKRIVHTLLTKVDQQLIEPITRAAAEYESRMQNGTKPIFHLEAFVARFICIYLDYLAEINDEIE